MQLLEARARAPRDALPRRGEKGGRGPEAAQHNRLAGLARMLGAVAQVGQPGAQRRAAWHSVLLPGRRHAIVR